MRTKAVYLISFVALLLGLVAPACKAQPSFQVTGLTIMPDQALQGQKVTVSAVIENAGKGEGTYAAQLIVNGLVIDTKSVSPPPGSSQNVQFTLTENESGVYTVEIGSFQEVLKVLTPASFEVTSLTIVPDQVGRMQQATVTAIVTNVGQATGDYSAMLSVNGIEMETKDITVPGGATGEAVFSIVKERAQTYEVSVGDKTARLTVSAGFYRNTFHGFSVSFPESWTVDETGEQNRLVDLIDPSNALRAWIGMTYVEDTLSLEEIGAGYIDAFELVANFKVISQSETALADSTPAYQVLMAGQDTQSEIRLVLVLIPRGTQVFENYFITNESHLDTVSPTIEEIYSSFRLEEPQLFGIPRSEALMLYSRGPTSLDPAASFTTSEAVFVEEIFSGLVTFDQNLNLIPNIASDWDISEDGKTYTFYLRDGVRFHNGKQVTADDFKYSMERACHPDTGSERVKTYLGDIVGAEPVLAGEAQHIGGIKVIDDSTLEITIDAPKSYFLSKLTHSTTFVVDRQNVNSGDEWWRQPNGTGPFKLKQWKEDEVLILERNDLFYREPAKIGHAVYRLWGGVPIRMYESGEIDMSEVYTNDIEKVLDPTNPLNKELTVVPQFSLSFIGFNSTKPPFDDPKIRQAFSHAIDKDELIEIVLKGIGRRADGILPPGFPGYNETVMGLSFDPQKAKDLITESTYQDISKLPQITFTSLGRGTVVPLYAALVDMWRQNLGIEVQIRQLDPDIYFDKIMDDKDEMYSYGWGADYPDPHTFLDVLFKSGSKSNVGEYSNPQIDVLLDQAAIEPDDTIRMKLYQDVEQMLVDDAACLPIYFDVNYVLIKPYIEGMVVTPMLIPTLQYVTIKPH